MSALRRVSGLGRHSRGDVRIRFQALRSGASTTSPSSFTKRPISRFGRISSATSDERHSLTPFGITTIGRLMMIGWPSGYRSSFARFCGRRWRERVPGFPLDAVGCDGARTDVLPHLNWLRSGTGPASTVSKNVLTYRTGQLSPAGIVCIFVYLRRPERMRTLPRRRRKRWRGPSSDRRHTPYPRRFESSSATNDAASSADSLAIPPPGSKCCAPTSAPSSRLRARHKRSPTGCTPGKPMLIGTRSGAPRRRPFAGRSRDPPGAIS